eukprot:GHVT01048431.1.p1 GENE.GHVT01048431.1~~GHVT01048431.1.p1  ORF type:complete len:458 (-),score=122.81 GHVT01048431.1:1792-3096(-)
MYVLCPHCTLPEIDIMVKKGEMLLYKCNACGDSGSLDMAHKAATYMIRNPPDHACSTTGKKKKSKEERRAEKAGRQREEDEIDEDAASATPANSVGGKDRSRKKKSSKSTGDKATNGLPAGSATEQLEEKKKTKKKAAATANGEDEDETLSNGSAAKAGRVPKSGTTSAEGSSPCHTPARSDSPRESSSKKKDKNEGADSLLPPGKLTFSSPEIAEVIERLRTFLTATDDVSPASFAQEVRVLQVSQDFDIRCRLFVVFAVILGPDVTPTSLEGSMRFIEATVDRSAKQEDILKALEHFVVDIAPAAIPSYPYLLQKLYKSSLLEGEDIINYYDDKHAEKAEAEYWGKCKQTAAPFLAWLGEVESDSDSDEEEDEEPEEEANAQTGQREMPRTKITTSQQAGIVLKPLYKPLAAGENEKPNQLAQSRCTMARTL